MKEKKFIVGTSVIVTLKMAKRFMELLQVWIPIYVRGKKSIALTT